MKIYFFTFVIVVVLILTNAVTDAPNAIATLVGTKVMNFKKAARLSAIFNFIGIVVMSFVNISVAGCISSMVDLSDSQNGIIVLISAMLSVIIFALVAMGFGIPTSETHGLIAGLTGSTVAIYGWNSVSLSEWANVLVGLIWSILGTLIIGYIIVEISNKVIVISGNNSIKKWQIAGCLGMSFMHGAQDGQKFIGILIILYYLEKNMPIPDILNSRDYVGIIICTAVIMAIGVSIGGKKIVDNIGHEMVELDNKKALLSDIITMIVLFVASVLGIPVSTTHTKTMSIVSIGKNTQIDKTKLFSIIKAWTLNFPISAGIGYCLASLIKMVK